MATTRTSPISVRPSSRPSPDYVIQVQAVTSPTSPQSDPTGRGGGRRVFGGPQLLKQMMIGFTLAGCVGLIMLVLGTIFVAKAVSSKQPITVMLCVMGIVFGIIIIAGTIILGRLLITRKCDKCHGRSTSAPSQCFHTCSIIYSPSIDQMGTVASEPNSSDPPPSYSTLLPSNHETVAPSVTTVNMENARVTPMAAVLFEPPKYEEVNYPLPEYHENIEDDNCLPPYEENSKETGIRLNRL